MMAPVEWDVRRDADGNPITLTPEQVGAALHAVSVVEQVRRAEGYPSMWENPYPNLAKSRLLGRMLIDGRPPLAEKPGKSVGARDYASVEPDLHHWYLGQVFVVTMMPRES